MSRNGNTTTEPNRLYVSLSAEQSHATQVEPFVVPLRRCSRSGATVE